MKQISIIGLSIMSVVFFAFNNFANHIDYTELSYNTVTVDVIGAVENRGFFEINVGDTILDVMNKTEYGVQLTIYADKESFDDPLKEVEEGMELLIPYKKGFEPSEPIPCVDDLTVEVLTKHGIVSNKIALAMIEYIKVELKGMVKTYDQLLGVTGIGQVTAGKISAFSKLC